MIRGADGVHVLEMSPFLILATMVGNSIETPAPGQEYAGIWKVAGMDDPGEKQRG